LQAENAMNLGWLCTQISITMPTARPKRAPMAIEGRMIPAGICNPKVTVAKKKPTTAANRRRTIVPAVAAPVLHSPNWSSTILEHSANREYTNSDD